MNLLTLEMACTPAARLCDRWANLRPLAAFADGPVADTAETVTPQTGIVGAEPDRDDGHAMGHTE